MGSKRAGSSLGRFIKRITSSHVFLSGVLLLALSLLVVVVRSGNRVALAALRFLHFEDHLVPVAEGLQVLSTYSLLHSVVHSHSLFKHLEERQSDVSPGRVVREVAMAQVRHNLLGCNLVLYRRAVLSKINFALEHRKNLRHVGVRAHWGLRLSQIHEILDKGPANDQADASRHEGKEALHTLHSNIGFGLIDLKGVDLAH